MATRVGRLLRVLSNPHNVKVALRIFRRVKDPMGYLHFLVGGSTSTRVTAITPIGEVDVHLRNHESGRTFFSIFMREDYPLCPDRSMNIIDVGSNVGLSALYFLSRNPCNKVFCVEPDPANLDVLKKNLQPFEDRVWLVTNACSSGDTGEEDFFVAEDGKYSSLLSFDGAREVVKVKLRPLADLMREAIDLMGDGLTSLKVDIEGLEEEVILSVPKHQLNEMETIFVEALGVGDKLGEGWSTTTRTGCVEVINNLHSCN